MRQDRAHRFTCGALETPDDETAQTNPGIMGVARHTTAAATGRCVGELKTQREDEGEDTLDKGFAVVNQPKVGGFIFNWLRVLHIELTS